MGFAPSARGRSAIARRPRKTDSMDFEGGPRDQRNDRHRTRPGREWRRAIDAREPVARFVLPVAGNVVIQITKKLPEGCGIAASIGADGTDSRLVPIERDETSGRLTFPVVAPGRYRAARADRGEARIDSRPRSARHDAKTTIEQVRSGETLRPIAGDGALRVSQPPTIQPHLSPGPAPPHFSAASLNWISLCGCPWMSTNPSGAPSRTSSNIAAATRAALFRSTGWANRTVSVSRLLPGFLNSGMAPRRVARGEHILDIGGVQHERVAVAVGPEAARPRRHRNESKLSRGGGLHHLAEARLEERRAARVGDRGIGGEDLAHRLAVSPHATQPKKRSAPAVIMKGQTQVSRRESEPRLRRGRMEISGSGFGGTAGWLIAPKTTARLHACETPRAAKDSGPMPRETHSGWRTAVPFGLLSDKPRHFREMAKVAWENRDQLGFAWRILRDGVCDGCSLGPRGLRDDVIPEPTYALTRLRLLRVNTMPAFEGDDVASVERLRQLTNEELQHLGRIPFPMIRRNGDAGFRRIGWDAALDEAAKSDPRHAAGAPRLLRHLARDHQRNVLRLPEGGAIVGEQPRGSLRAPLPRGVGLGAEGYDWGRRAHLLTERFHRHRFVGVDGDRSRQQSAGRHQVSGESQGSGDADRRGEPLPRSRGSSGYWVPSLPMSAVFGTKLQDDFFQVRVAGDIAFLNGVLRALIEKGGIDRAFIDAHTTGFAEAESHARSLRWESIEEESGLPRAGDRALRRSVCKGQEPACSSIRWDSRSTASASRT